MQTAGKLIWMFYKFTLFLLCLSGVFSRDYVAGEERKEGLRKIEGRHAIQAQGRRKRRDKLAGQV